jgi:hypothetical protein
MNVNWFESIKVGILETIKDPESPKARKSDCYANCAKFINKNKSEDYSILIYGFKGTPFHGVVVDNKNNNILVDTFENKRKSGAEEQIVYNDGHKEIKLDLMERLESSLWCKKINEVEFPKVEFPKVEVKDVKNINPNTKFSKVRH